MVFSKRSHEGWLMVDHTAGDGLNTPEAAVAGALPVGGGMKFEASTITCSHCQRVVIVNPARTRQRGYCPKCDHYVCDTCETARVASGGECKTFKQIMDEVDNLVQKKGLIA